MTTASVCWLQNGIFCPWQQGHTFVWLFGGDGCTPPPSPCCSWKWTFCLCVFNASNKTAAQRQGQLSHRTAATIVCMFAYTCVHGPSAHRCKLCVRGFLLGFLENLDWNSTSCIWKCQECELFMFAFGMWVSGIKDFPQTTSKYWHQADCLVYNLNFSLAHFLLSMHLMCVWPKNKILICKKSWLRFVNILQNGFS